MKSRPSLASAAALAALAIASVAPVHADEKTGAQEELVRCYGINSCKGNSLCATAKNDCKGLNNCKGQGVVVKTKSGCLKEGGTLTEPK